MQPITIEALEAAWFTVSNPYPQHKNTSRLDWRSPNGSSIGCEFIKGRGFVDFFIFAPQQEKTTGGFLLQIFPTSMAEIETLKELLTPK